MSTFADLKRDKSLRDAYESYLKRKGWIGVYDFGMKKQTPQAEMKFLLNDISNSENAILDKAGDEAKRIVRLVNQQMAEDAAANLPKMVSSPTKQLSVHPAWVRMRTKAKKAAVEFVSGHLSNLHFVKSKEYLELEEARQAADWKRLSVDFEQEFDLDKGALAEFKRLDDIKEARFKKAMEKMEADLAKKKQPKKKARKMPTFGDLRAFVKRKTGKKI